MISVVVFYYSNTLQSMLKDYAVTEMGCFDDYSDATPCAKKMRGMVLLPFFSNLINVSLSIFVFVTAALISEISLKSLYSRLGFKVIKYLRHLLISKRLARNFIMSQ